MCDLQLLLGDRPAVKEKHLRLKSLTQRYLPFNLWFRGPEKKLPWEQQHFKTFVFLEKIWHSQEWALNLKSPAIFELICIITKVTISQNENFLRTDAIKTTDRFLWSVLQTLFLKRANARLVLVFSSPHYIIDPVFLICVRRLNKIRTVSKSHWKVRSSFMYYADSLLAVFFFLKLRLHIFEAPVSGETAPTNAVNGEQIFKVWLHFIEKISGIQCNWFSSKRSLILWWVGFERFG